MCGINGLTWSDQNVIEEMNKRCKHRGPDSDGFHVDTNVSLGHVRLSIIDPSSVSDQPMYSREKDVVLVFNGEIYNFQSLRSELESGYEFLTKSDTEVILAGYKKWGKEVFSRLNGIYAISIWDINKKELFLARDTEGVKPLYYASHDNGLIFSSEIKSILAAGIPATLDKTAFQYYMRLRYVPGPRTMFAGITQVEPGQLICWKDGQVKKERIAYSSQSSFGKLSVRETIAESIKRQVVSDKPVGVFLSGGIDSTIVTYEAKKHITDLHSFSTVFLLENEALSDRYNQDAFIAEKTAKHLGTTHHKVVLKGSDAINNLEKMVWHMDVPVPSMTMFSQYEIARYAKEYVDVALGGDGGDEYFAGYHRYRYARMMDFYQLLPKLMLNVTDTLNPNLKKLSTIGVVPLLEQFAIEPDNEIAQLLQEYQPALLDEFLQENVKEYDSHVDTLMKFDQRFWLPDFSLIRSDKLSMAHGLELRVPMLDQEVIAVAEGLSIGKKIGFFKNKKVLRNAYDDIFPESVKRAPKRGWISPGSKWLREPIARDYFQSVLSRDYYEPTSGLFDWEVVERYFSEHVEGGVYHYNSLIAIAVFQIWAKQFEVTL